MKTDMRIVKTKEALHEALLTLLDEKSLETISITELCRTARVNRGTFYLHYGRVEDVFEEYFREITADLAVSYQEPYRHVAVLKTSELDPDTIRIFHHVKKYERFYRIVFSKNVPLQYYYLLFEEVKGLLLTDPEAEVRVGIDAGLFSAYQANAIIGMLLHWCQHDFSYTVDELNRQLVRIVSAGTTGQ
ncbi:TetR family transcriptional regulator [Sporosarcina sp. NCCP-2716]|nr:TetR family transcriptional regulator [Sporosarcina sp. NCCP-2716]